MFRQLLGATIARLPAGRVRIARRAGRIFTKPFVDRVGPRDLQLRALVDPKDPFSLEMWVGAYQPHVVAFLRRWVFPGATVLCAGLQVGYIANIARRLAGVQGRVLSAEPDEEARAAGLANLALLDPTHSASAEVLHAGLSDAEGELPMYKSAVLGHSSFAAPHQGTGLVQTRLVRGDHWLGSLGIQSLDVMVLDVEGWEVHALNGLTETLERSKRLVALVECSNWALRDAGSSPEELYAFWTERNFCVQRVGKTNDLLVSRGTSIQPPAT